MTTPIDDLLEFLRTKEMLEEPCTANYGNAAGGPPPIRCRHQHDSMCIDRYIAAVEELQDTAILWAALSATQREKTVCDPNRS